jgi:site-specific DNA recombinase
MLGAKPARRQRLTEDQIAKIVEGLGGLLALLHNADPLDRTEIYARVGLQMTYRPGTETVIAEVISPAIDGVLDVCPTDTDPKYTIEFGGDILID